MTKLEQLTGPQSLSADESAALEDITVEVNDALMGPYGLLTRTDDFCARQPYTAVGLAQIAVWCRAHGDDRGADMLEAFTREFARHEATIV